MTAAAFILNWYAALSVGTGLWLLSEMFWPSGGRR